MTCCFFVASWHTCPLLPVFGTLPRGEQASRVTIQAYDCARLHRPACFWLVVVGLMLWGALVAFNGMGTSKPLKVGWWLDEKRFHQLLYSLVLKLDLGFNPPSRLLTR